MKSAQLLTIAAVLVATAMMVSDSPVRAEDISRSMKAAHAHAARCSNQKVVLSGLVKKGEDDGQHYCHEKTHCSS